MCNNLTQNVLLKRATTLELNNRRTVVPASQRTDSRKERFLNIVGETVWETDLKYLTNRYHL